MKSQLLIVLILVLISTSAFPQCTEFTIYRTKGDVTLNPGSVKGTALKNMKFQEQAVLNIPQDGYVILLSGTDKALRLTTPGKYTYNEIKTTCRQKQTSLTTEYLKYVAQSITEKEEPLTAMVIKGAVYRTRQVFEKTDMILPADSSVISSDLIRFAWHPTTGIPSKYLKIYENGVKEIYSKLLADTTALIESSLLKPQNIYFWLVTTKQQPTDDEVRFTFVFGEKEWKTDFLDNEDQLMKELESEINAMEKKMKK
ncbi:MAG: hypothetical protein WCR01_13575 [Bacteroidota bacterium]